VRLLLVNENIGGHETVHANLGHALGEIEEVDADFLHVPAPGLGRRIVGARIPGLDRLDLDLKPLRAQLALSAYVRRRIRRRLDRYDALYVYTHNAALLSPDLLRRLPTVVALDTTNAQNAYRLPYRRPTRFTPLVLPLTQSFERRVYRAATLVVANSEWAAESLRDDYGVPRSRIRVVPTGLRIPPDAPVGPEPQLPRIVFVGRSMERKGGNFLLALHRRHLRERCILTIVTPERVPPEPGVEVINDIRPGDPRLYSLLRSARLFAFPSEVDMFPNAVLEAMAAGLPVVAMRVGAVPEMVPDGVAGLLVEPGAESEFRRALETLLDDPARAEAMGAAARRRFEERYDVRVTARGLLDVVREAIELYGARPKLA
jgi:starch synthase